MTSHDDTDRDAVAAVIDTFFSAFVSGAAAVRGAELLRQVLLPEAVIVRACGLEPVSYTVETFIQPRVELLAAGRLHDFRERAVTTRIDVFGDIAQAWCWYDKSWSEDGQAHHEHGMKTIQLIRTGAGWRISALAWDDERPGLTVPTVEWHPAGAPP